MITVQITGTVNTTISVSPLDSISSALNALELNHHRALYNGTFLVPSLSFSFYNINNNDTIFIVKKKETTQLSPPEQKPKYQHLPTSDIKQLRIAFNEKYGNKLRDPDTVFEFFKNSLDPTYSKEVGRTNDLFRQRMEAVPSIFRKIYQRVNKFSSRSSNTDEQLFPTILPEKALEPSTELLPILTVSIDNTT